MNQKTMLDMGGLAFLEGDPLGLRELEEKLVWNPNGPLPDWLDDAGLDDDDDSPLYQGAGTTSRLPEETPPPIERVLPPERRETVEDAVRTENPDLVASKLAFTGGDVPAAEEPLPVVPTPEPLMAMLPAVVVNSPHEPGPPAPSLIDGTPLAAELIEDEFEPFPDPESDAACYDAERSAEMSGEHSGLGLRSIDDIIRFVDALPSPAPEAPEPLPVPPPLLARRVLGFDELIDLRLCLLTSVAGQSWAVPLDRIASVGRRRSADSIDLHERFEGRPRRGEAAAITFDTDRTLLVDRVLGPRSFAWEPLANDTDAPKWALAETTLAGESIRLLDWEVFEN